MRPKRSWLGRYWGSKKSLACVREKTRKVVVVGVARLALYKPGTRFVYNSSSYAYKVLHHSINARFFRMVSPRDENAIRFMPRSIINLFQNSAPQSKHKQVPSKNFVELYTRMRTFLPPQATQEISWGTKIF